ncbi:phage antirepressor [Weissella soli]|uniref:phage antirepressor n=1 Tax=Weissella soli TaxID=155866 RepID=UPI003C76A872
MAEEVQVFNFEQMNVRTIELEDEVWFVAVDVAKALDIKNTTQALSRLDDDERAMFNIGRQGEANIISEAGLYRFIGNSRKSEAKKFTRWVTHEVLPSIRKTGSYGVRELSQEEIVGKAFMIEHNRAEKLQIENNVLKPKAELHDKFIATGSAIGIRESAKEIGVKQNLLIDDLINNHYLYRTGSRGRLQPYAQYVGKWFVLKSVVINGSALDVTPQTLITPKGREHFYKLIYAPDQTELCV